MYRIKVYYVTCFGQIQEKMFKGGAWMIEGSHIPLVLTRFQSSWKNMILILFVGLTRYCLSIFYFGAIFSLFHICQSTDNWRSCNVRLLRMGMNSLLTDSLSPYSRPRIIVVNLIMLVRWWALMKLWCAHSKFSNLLREKTNLWGQTKCEMVKPFRFQQLWGQLLWFNVWLTVLVPLSMVLHVFLYFFSILHIVDVIDAWFICRVQCDS